MLVQVEEKNSAIEPSTNNHENECVYLTTDIPETS